MVRITRISKTKYKFVCEKFKEERLCKTALSFEDENLQYAPSYKEGNWDGVIKFYGINNDFRIGHLSRLKDFLTEHSVPFEVQETNWFERFDFSRDLVHKKLRLHQVEAIESIFQNNIGIIKIPTRGGKTLMSAEFCRIILSLSPKSKCLFIVDTIDLLNQSKEEFDMHLGLGICGLIHGSNRDYDKQICFTTIQTLGLLFNSEVVKDKKEVRKYLKSLKCLIIDEVHEFTSENRRKIVSFCSNLEYQIGMSATPFKSSSELATLNMLKIFGNVIIDIKEKTLIERGVLTDYKVALFLYESEFSHHLRGKLKDLKKNNNKKVYSFLQNQLIFENSDRDYLIENVLNILKKYKLKTLVLFTSVKHGNLFSKKFGYNFLSGVNSAEQRKSQTKDFLLDKGGILLASNIYKKGITLPEVEVMINVDGGLELSNVIQKKGRVLGSTENKKRSLIIDIIDNESNYFSEHSLQRLSMYESTVDESKISLFENDSDSFLNFEKLVSSWLVKKK
jgi:superfamily II DNA or RNA helicase